MGKSATTSLNIALFPQAIVKPFIRPFIYLPTGKDGWRRKDPVCA
jgi:hypothetical protein